MKKLITERKVHTAVAVFFILGGVAGYLINIAQNAGQEPKITKITRSNNSYVFTRPLLAFEVGDKKEFLEYKSMETKLRDLINQNSESGNIQDVSIYFRDLNNGRWTGVNENDKFSPGSLLKVPIMIAYYKMAENDPSILSKEITNDNLTEDYNSDEIIKPDEVIKRGNTYTVDDLIKRMIIYSDNDATVLLFNNIDKRALNDVFSDLGISFNEDPSTEDFISTKQYSLFFRVLFNSSYLDPVLSEKALSLLSKADFKNGLRSNLPTDINISHKFGEREYKYGDNKISTYEFHDCGIVYYTNNPYILCVMTKGNVNNIKVLESLAQKISSLIYDEVTNNYK